MASDNVVYPSVAYLEAESEKFSKAKIEALFGGRGYSDAQLGIIRSAMEVGYISGAQDERKRICERIDTVLAGRTQ